MEITEFDSNQKTMINAFKTRLNLEVYGMEKEYEELNGYYSNRGDIEQKIFEFKTKDLFEETKSISLGNKIRIIGKCKKCHSYNLPTINDTSNNNIKSPYIITNYFICETDDCYANETDCKWHNVKISENSNIIYTLCNTGNTIIGKYKFV